MTMFPSTSKSVQAPGGARTGSVRVGRLSSPSEFKTRETGSVVRMLPNQAGGPASIIRVSQAARGRSLLNGKTETCRGAGRSARIPFLALSLVIAVNEMRTPGGIRVSDTLLC
jgi:hypothetical protein